MKIYVVRHGETDVNLKNQVNGWNDDDINENGINQAKSAREKMQNVDYDLVISSPLTRTRHTTQIVNYKNADVIYDERILELDAKAFTKFPVENLDCDDWWNLKRKKDYGDAETVLHLLDRVYQFLKEIKTKYPDKNIMIVTHGGVCKAVQCYFKGIPQSETLNDYRQGNCEIKEYEL